MQDLIQRLMCDVDDRLGTRGVHEIMVRGGRQEAGGGPALRGAAKGNGVSQLLMQV